MVFVVFDLLITNPFINLPPNIKPSTHPPTNQHHSCAPCCLRVPQALSHLCGRRVPLRLLGGIVPQHPHPRPSGDARGGADPRGRVALDVLRHAGHLSGRAAEQRGQSGGRHVSADWKLVRVLLGIGCVRVCRSRCAGGWSSSSAAAAGGGRQSVFVGQKSRCAPRCFCLTLGLRNITSTILYVLCLTQPNRTSSVVYNGSSSSPCVCVGTPHWKPGTASGYGHQAHTHTLT